MTSTLTIAIAGNPNCGKSALFNAFTGIRQRTGNWPGVTVDRKEGHFALDDRLVTVIDLPGIYSLDASSLDERITRDYLLARDFDLIINVVDAANLERNLYLTVQLLEMGVPVVLALNMMDVARRHGLRIDPDRLAQELGCPVVPVVAVTGEGKSALMAATMDVASGQSPGGYSLAHDELVEEAARSIAAGLRDTPAANRRWVALKQLEGDPDHRPESPDGAHRLAQWRTRIEERCGEDVDIHIADTRFSHAHTLAVNTVQHRGRAGRTLTDRIDRVVIGRWLGVPVFLAVIYLMFLFTINIGGAFIDFFDGVAGAIFVDGVRTLLAGAGAPGWLQALLADGVGNGIQVVATFVPIIASLYLFLSVLEDSGYMARAAFVMDRFMRAIGLPGKAFVPLIVGFGCNVPAVMATRTLEHERERKLTILMNPFMSCGARLPVYALFAAAFFPNNGQNIVFVLYLVGIAVAITTGLVMKQTLLSGESSGFMMELPPYHRPTWRGVLLRTWDRVQLFVREAGRVIVLMVVALNLLSSVGTDGSFGNENTERSLLSGISRQLAPVFSPMGIREENWPALVGIFSGVLAKEVVVGTLDSLYTRLAAEHAPIGDARAFDLFAALKAASATVPENLAEIAGAVFDPLGLDIGVVDDPAAAAAAQSVDAGVFGAMAQRFDGQAGAFAYLLFILLYMPCVATLGAVRREAGGPWTVFVAVWTTGIAYLTATIYYQSATWADHPVNSALWIGGSAVVLLMVSVGLRGWSMRDRTNPRHAKVAA